MKVHCIGIGGAGLSGLARILRGSGHILSGEDVEEGPFLPGLRESGIQVTVGDARSLPEGTDLVVRSAAVRPSHPRLRQAREQKVPVRKYAEALSLAGEGARVVAVAGTHGKTTTTALISHILVEAGRDPSFLVGGHVPHLGGSARVGGGGLFVVEACEYDRSFLHLAPWAGVITNVEADHLDCYRDLEDIVEAFGEFVSKIHPDGILVIPDGDPGAEGAARRARCRVERFRLEPGADWGVRQIHRRRDGTDCRVVQGGKDLGSLWIPVAGTHNVSNGIAAAAVTRALGLSFREIREGLASFRTVDRRFQVVRSDDDLAVVSDYAHHPTEIRTVVESSRQVFGNRRRVIVFQPHQRARTEAFLDRFAAVLRGAGRCLVAPIYGAREGGGAGEVSAETLVDRICRMGGDAALLPDLPEIPDRVGKELRSGDVVLVLGAGDIYQVVEPIAALRPSRRPSRTRRSARLSGRRKLSDLTSFHLGGPVGTYRRPGNLTELQRILRDVHEKGGKLLCVGGGNNLLARDEGFQGTVIDMRGLSRVAASRTHIIAQAGASLPRLMRLAERLSLSGLEPLAGIPGTVGGGVVMNAGGRFGSISDVVEGVGIILADGRIIFRRKEELQFRYRGCDTGGGIIYEVVLALKFGKRQEIRRRSVEIMNGKRRSQPYGQASAGCIFRNPAGDSAGRLIDAAGLKGARIGGAMVSMLHANFIVNDGEATTHDVLQLIQRVQESVKDRFGVELELEVQVV